jgi:putative ABC transport system permease protein
METLVHDVKHSIRMFAQSKAFTATAIAALALGIGANTAIFSIVNAVLLKPVPFPEPDRLVMFMNTTPGGQGPAASPAKFQHWRSQSTIQDAAAFRTGIMNYTGGEAAEQLRSAQVSADYFKLFGAPVVRGRGFSKDEDLPNGEKVALISYSLWSRRFASDAGIVGKNISLSGEPYAIIGIVGPDFDVREFGPAPEVWTPFQLDPNTSDQGHYFQAAGRLKPGVHLEQAMAEFKQSAEEYRRKFPNAIRPVDAFTVVPFQEAFVSNVRQTLLVLLGAVSFVLLIACANVANLLLVRATARKREIAIRTSLGARRVRIIRQLLTESVLLSLVGGVLGIVLGMGAIRALLSINTAGLPRIGENGSMVGIDWRVLAFTLMVSILTGILFGVFPALHGSRADLSSSLKEGTGRSGTGLRQNKLRSLLVVIEIALAVILLVGSALFIRVQMALASVNPGFDTTNVLTMRMSLTGPRFLKASGVEQIVREGVERIRALPGVESAAATCCVPLQGGYGLPFVIAGRPLANGPFHGGGGWLTVSSGFFEVFKIPVKRGRSFTDRDDNSSPPVVIINETMAKQYWIRGDDPLNSRLIIGRGVMREFKDEPERQIIGIVGDVRDAGLNNEPQPRMYVPQAQVPDAVNALNVRITPVAWVVRSKTEPHSLSASVQEQLRQVTGLPVSDIRSMEDVVSLSTSRQRFNMLLMTVFGSAALILAAIGIYGLMAYSVEQRTPELGIRLALGAEVSQLQKMVIRQGMTLTIVGIIIGISFAFNLTRFISRFLFNIKPWDPAVFIFVPVVLGCVALLAVWTPARRASQINPMDALRYE